MKSQITTKETSVYRHYDSDNILLYIGISQDFLSRTFMHKRSAHWWRQIATIKVEHFSAREDAEIAEKLAIIKERPIFNTTYSTDPLLPQKKITRWHDGIRPRNKVTIIYPDEYGIESKAELLT